MVKIHKMIKCSFLNELKNDECNQLHFQPTI